MKKTSIAVLIFGLALAGALAQRRWWGGYPGGGDTGYTSTEENVPVNVDKVRTAREIAEHSTETPSWTNPAAFAKDVFTFVRIIYRRAADGPRISATSSTAGWITDFPDSDLNLSYRVQQVTSIRTDPDGRVLRLTDPTVFDYPWIYMVEPGGLELRPEEVLVLRKYLENGGVLMADDFWGRKQWDNFERNIKLALPNRQFVDLDMTNQLFHCVFNLNVPMNSLQTPNYRQGINSLIPGSRQHGITWEPYHDDYDRQGTRDMHVRAIYDERGRIMVIAMHNCDNGDGWEREGEEDGFFHEFSEKRAYPLAINTIFYLMTH